MLAGLRLRLGIEGFQICVCVCVCVCVCLSVYIICIKLSITSTVHHIMNMFEQLPCTAPGRRNTINLFLVTSTSVTCSLPPERDIAKETCIAPDRETFRSPTCN